MFRLGLVYILACAMTNGVQAADTGGQSEGSVLQSDVVTDLGDVSMLSDRHRNFARRFVEFLTQMDAFYFGGTENLNQNGATETRSITNEYGAYHAKVARGNVIEKAGRSLNITDKPTAWFQKDSDWSRYYLLDSHPKTPRVGMLHAAIVMKFFPDGSSTIAGFLDILKSANQPEDLRLLEQSIGEVYEKYDIDPQPYRHTSCMGIEDDSDGMETNKRFRRKSECVGGSFYARPLFEVNERNFAFMLEAYETFVRTYFDIIERRADEPVSAEDLKAQDAMRRNWLEDRFFSDPFTQNVTPYEIWSFMSLPPNVKF